MSRIGPVDVECLKERIAALIEHVELKTQRRQDTLRDLLRVGEIKVCMEFIRDGQTPILSVLVCFLFFHICR